MASVPHSLDVVHLAKVSLAGVLAVLTACGPQSTEPADPPLIHEISNVIVPRDSELWFQFVVTNTSEMTWSDVWGGVTFFDNSGAEIGWCKANDLSVSFLHPTESAYLSAICDDIEFASHQVAVYPVAASPNEVEASCLDGRLNARQLVVVETGREYPFAGSQPLPFTRVHGVVVNVSTMPALSGSAHIAAFDGAGQLLGVDGCRLAFPLLRWKEQASFSCEYLFTEIPDDGTAVWMVDGTFACSD